MFARLKTLPKRLATRKAINQRRAEAEATSLVGLAGCVDDHTSRGTAPT